MIRLIGFDLDGTLFTDDKRVTDVTRKTVAEAARRGVVIVPVTGRPFKAVPDNVKSLPGVHYMVTASGAVIYDLEENRILMHDVIPNERMIEIARTLRQKGYICMVFINGTGYVSRDDHQRAIDYASSEAAKIYMRDYRVPVDDLVTFIRESGEGIEKFTVNLPFDENGDLIGLQDALKVLEPYEENLHEVYGGDINLEVGSRTSNKGSALLWLGNYLGIKKDEIMAIGDSGNDLDMADGSGLFVAVANATEPIKAAAHHITLSNEEDGVAAAIRRFVLEA